MQFIPLDKTAHLKRFILACVHNGRIEQLAGNANREYRQAIIQLITGEKRPFAKCGIGEVEDLLFTFAGITEYTCEANRRRQLENWILTAKAKE
jgi:hypothetical protein